MAGDHDKVPEYRDEDEQGGIFRWMSGLVVLMAVAGFFGLAWYAYKSGDTTDDKDVETIHADANPVKEAPANPGGMEIPDQDKTVYGLINGNRNNKPAAEHVLPAPEEPIKRPDVTQAPAEPAKPAVAAAPATTQPAPASAAAPATPAPVVVAAQDQPRPVQFDPKTHELPQSASAAAPAAPQAETAPLPVTGVAAPEAPVILKHVPEKASADDDDDADAKDTGDADKPAAPPSAAPAGHVRIQLGAFKSEGEAKGEWARIARKFTHQLDGKPHYILRADLGAKGIYYRLQAGAFVTSKAAEQFCRTLAGQGCLVVKGK